MSNFTRRYVLGQDIVSARDRRRAERRRARQWWGKMKTLSEQDSGWDPESKQVSA